MAGHGDRRGHDHRQRHFPCSARNDAGCGLLQPCLPGVDCCRDTFTVWRDDLRRVGGDAPICGRRICVSPRRLRGAAIVSLHVDVVLFGQTRLHCQQRDWPGSCARYFFTADLAWAATAAASVSPGVGTDCCHCRSVADHWLELFRSASRRRISIGFYAVEGRIDRCNRVFLLQQFAGPSRKFFDASSMERPAALRDSL